MSNEAKLGTVPSGNEGKDAVHVAIIPACAATFLRIGLPVRLNDKSKLAETCEIKDAIGIVDPFRPKEQCIVAKGSWFWLCLYPKTITGLRHVWEHPSFPSSPIKSTSNKIESETWLRTYILKYSNDYDEFLRYVKKERKIFYYGTDCHRLSDVEDADELFRHLSVVLEYKIDAAYFESFSCSC